MYAFWFIHRVSFKELKILKLNDIYKLNLCAIMFSHIADPHNYPISDRLVRNSHLHSYNTRNREDFVIPRYSKTTSQSCFLYQSTVEWNKIPPVIKDCRNVKTFRKKFKTYILDLYWVRKQIYLTLVNSWPRIC